MAVRFVLGPAGSGKTDYCLRQIAAELEQAPVGEPLLFVLPSQATFLHEKMLAAAVPGGGFSRAAVCSFARLVQQAYLASGKEPLPHLSEAGKLMLMRNLIQQQQGRLEVFAAVAHRADFTSQMVAVAEELQSYAVSAEQLQQAAKNLEQQQGHNHLANKVTELALLYQHYQAAVAGSYGNLAEGMSYLAAQIEQGLLAEATIYVDGYSSFTPLELAVLAAMMQNCKELVICLCLSPEQAEQTLREDDVFYPTWHSYGQLHELAASRGVEVLPPICPDGKQGRFVNAPELSALERSLRGLPEQPLAGEPQTVQLWQLRNRSSELMAVGREIRRLVREEGLRYREISIITRSSEAYLHLLPQVFAELQIPYFVDHKKELRYHPLLELLTAAVEIWAYQPHYANIMRFFKNIFSPIYGQKADRLENYCLAHGVRFYHWQLDGKSAQVGPPWQFPLLDTEDEAAVADINQIRAEGLAPLAELMHRLGKAATAEQFVAALQGLLPSLNLPAQMQALVEAAQAAGDGALAMQHAQAYQTVQSFFAEAQLLLGEASFSASEWLDLLQTAFSSLTLSTIPPGNDEVLVASLERSRNPEIRAAFVLNLNEGVLPRKVVADGLLSDDERGLLSAQGVRLAADTLFRQFTENYLAYIALTRSSERLYLSYLLTDEEGKSLAPSPLLRRICALFPALRAVQPTVDAPHLVGGLADLELAAMHQGTDDDPLWQAVYQYYRQQPQYQNALQRIAAGRWPNPGRMQLSRDALQRLYGHSLRSSVSRLERFRMCPFSYFSSYGLKLRPRRKYELTPREQGDLFHHVLAEVGRTILEKELSWQEITPELASMLVDQALSGVLPRFLSGIMQSSARYAYLEGRIRATLVNAVLLTAEHMQRGKFVPVAYELSFGMGGAGLPALSVDLGDGRSMQLSGQIDRIDMAEGEDGQTAYFRVVDYKTGNLSLRQEDIAAGLRLQLLVYLQVVLANSAHFSPKPALPAGFYYAPVQDSIVSVEDVSTEKTVGLKLKGITVADREAVLLADPDINGHSELIPVGYNPEKGTFYQTSAPLSGEQLEALTEQLKDNLKETATAMLNGLIDVTPLRGEGVDACAFCDFAAVCGFERQLAPARSKDQPLLPEEVDADA